jgi:hypothetical protein
MFSQNVLSESHFWDDWQLCIAAEENFTIEFYATDARTKEARAAKVSRVLHSEHLAKRCKQK